MTFPDGICDVCGRDFDHCICPECPVCGEYGNPLCEADHRLIPSAFQIASLAEAKAQWDIWLKEEEEALDRMLAEDALADGIEAGDLDQDGEPIPYPRYP